MFTILEGPNGSGKTSLVNSLDKSKYKTLSSPNGTPLAKMLRSACRGTGEWFDVDPRVQFMLFSAARYDEYLRLVHDSQDIVVADRWWTSTYVYQCILQGIPIDFLEHTRHPQEKIDLVILLDGDDDILIDRVNAEREANPSHGKCRWTQDRETQIKLIQIYRNELREYLSNKNIPFEIINTTNLSKDEVKEDVEGIISHRYIISRLEERQEEKEEDKKNEIKKT